MRAAATLLLVLITSSASAAGFTKAEIDALPPPPGPEFFTRDALKRKPSRHPPVSTRTPRQRELLASKAQRRRMRGRYLDSRPAGDADVEFAAGATAAFAAGTWRLTLPR